jgi:hypothetical protein
MTHPQPSDADLDLWVREQLRTQGLALGDAELAKLARGLRRLRLDEALPARAEDADFNAVLQRLRHA